MFAHFTLPDVPDVARSVLRIEGLEVVYPGRQVPALRLPTLRVEPGEMVAVCGPSGCGKSTLLSVLLCLTTASAGSVHIGEMDLAELDPDLWRAQLSWVPQRPHLFARTIAENVRLSGRAVDVIFRAPVIFRDRRLQAGIPGSDPRLDAGNQLHAIGDPALIHVIGVP